MIEKPVMRETEWWKPQQKIGENMREAHVTSFELFEILNLIYFIYFNII